MRSPLLLSASAALSFMALAASCSSSGGSGATGPEDASVLTPGCQGTPDTSCQPYADGTQCPSLTMTCVACAPGLYEFAPLVCTCTAGSWACTSPPAGAVTCSTPSGQFVDPACSLLWPADAQVLVPIEGGTVDAGVDAGAGSDATDGAPEDAGPDADLDATDAAD